MALRPIVKYPDPRLGETCTPVEIFDCDLRQLADDLLATMRAVPGVGITAAHIGLPLRLVVLELSPQEAPRFYVNPQIVSASSDKIRHVEGSVSMPGFTEEVERARHVRLRYRDLDGAMHEEDVAGFHAVCIQHEIDQLDGIFWLKRLSRLKRERLISKWRKRA